MKEGEIIKVKTDINDLHLAEITTLVDEWQEAGWHNCEFQITNYGLTSGMYYYTIRIEERMESGKLMLIK